MAYSENISRPLFTSVPSPSLDPIAKTGEGIAEIHQINPQNSPLLGATEIIKETLHTLGSVADSVKQRVEEIAKEEKPPDIQEMRSKTKYEELQGKIPSKRMEVPLSSEEKKEIEELADDIMGRVEIMTITDDIDKHIDTLTKKEASQEQKKIKELADEIMKNVKAMTKKEVLKPVSERPKLKDKPSLAKRTRVLDFNNNQGLALASQKTSSTSKEIIKVPKTKEKIKSQKPFGEKDVSVSSGVQAKPKDYLQRKKDLEGLLISTSETLSIVISKTGTVDRLVKLKEGGQELIDANKQLHAAAKSLEAKKGDIMNKLSNVAMSLGQEVKNKSMTKEEATHLIEKMYEEVFESQVEVEAAFAHAKAMQTMMKVALQVGKNKLKSTDDKSVRKEIKEQLKAFKRMRAGPTLEREPINKEEKIKFLVAQMEVVLKGNIS